ncbi:surface-adhesin E family protein [Sphingomonas sp.]|uniref:surface-adhesin E family protein n=1 Tax=Sphingomonas sp. TaxID=28214 RepID=UPI003CC56A42
MRHSFIGVALVVSGLSQAAAAEWVRIATSDDGRTYSVDATRAPRIVGNRMQTWVQIDFSRDRTVSFRRAMQLWSFDCRAQTEKVISSSTYDSYGRNVDSYSEPAYAADTGYEPVVPETIGDKVFSLVCAAANN